MARLEGKVALITGAARGTGETTARLFVREGARVAVADLLDDRGQAVAKDLGDAAIFVHLDVTREDDWTRAVAQVVDRFGHLDVLVNNAGLLHLAAIADTRPEDMERLFRVNQLGTFLGIKSVIEPMKAQGGGSIVNVSSIDGLRGQNGTVAYGATKWAVRGITRVAALELGQYGIRVNCVCPAAGGPEMIQRFMPPGVDIEKVMAADQPILATQKSRTIAERVGDVAKMILFLASDESASCSGADFPVESANTAGKFRRWMPGG
jgi:3alpha(or 20beta)-hydroxysteroid dehydrogenase